MENNMAAAQNPDLSFSLTAVITKPLHLGTLNLV
jgi:hypothetical protein